MMAKSDTSVIEFWPWQDDDIGFKPNYSTLCIR